MAKYHLTDTFVPQRCSDSDACGREKHYSNREEAFLSRGKLAASKVLEEDKTAGSPAGPLPKGALSGNTVQVLTGEYWFGDPCYPLGEDPEGWTAWVEVVNDDPDQMGRGALGATYAGYPVVAVSTLSGDGVFGANDGHSYGVDSGCLGLVPEKLIMERKWDLGRLGALGSWVSIKAESSLSVDSDGRVQVGDLTVFTGAGLEETSK